ncbi:MAG TPA: SRPBCC family protein [Actinomycetota bacterium]|nr:SRPBCC family protein [Actinomycetota bacterium]
MSTTEQSIEVNVPVSTAYNQWTQFEEFPEFMEGVNKVLQKDDVTLEWEAEIFGQSRQWEAKIDEQTADQRIAWHSTGDVTQAGVVTFHRIDDGMTKVMLQMDFEPNDFGEKAADALGLVKVRIKGDLERFKKFIESRGSETGAWRGEVEQNDK